MSINEPLSKVNVIDLEIPYIKLSEKVDEN
jgi:hypothetical protein